jgi:L-ascorbate metabolism protein UlaG (beta-lactamase superfamily)
VNEDSRTVVVGFVGHATVLLDLGGIRILTDPFLRPTLGPLERHGTPPDAQSLADVDVVLISHGHADHFDRASLAMLGSRPTIVVPKGLGQTARRWAIGNVRELAVGERLDLDGRSIEAVPARHWITPGSPRAEPQGYLIDAGTRIWFAGDTGRFPRMDRLLGDVDAAFVPVWTWGPHLGPGHLGPRSAAEVIARIGARVAVPIHWGTLYPRRLHRLWRGPLDEPGERFAAHAARVAPATDVRVLRPGESTIIRSATDRRLAERRRAR